jgi:large subunit ribosomal protein L15
MNLSNLKPARRSQKARKRIGRGPGSGHGKTSCRGHKGQNSRSGGGTRIGFEGGQMPLARRLPKRGFTNIFKKRYALINIADLVRFDKDSTVDEAVLVENGLVGKVYDGIKLLGNGEIDKPINLKLHKWSKSAYDKIVAAGGKIEGV